MPISIGRETGEGKHMDFRLFLGEEGEKRKERKKIYSFTHVLLLPSCLCPRAKEKNIQRFFLTPRVPKKVSPQVVRFSVCGPSHTPIPIKGKSGGEHEAGDRSSQMPVCRHLAHVEDVV